MEAGRGRGRSCNWSGQGRVSVSNAANRWKDVLGRGSSRYECPQTGECLMWGGSKEAHVTGAEGMERRTAEDEIREERGSGCCRALGIIIYILALIWYVEESWEGFELRSDTGFIFSDYSA